MNGPIVILPRLYGDRMIKSAKKWGTLALIFDPAEEVFLVDGYSEATATKVTGLSPYVKHHHYLGSASSTQDAGLWYAAKPDLHMLGIEAQIREATIPLVVFKGFVTGAWQIPSQSSGTLVLTHAHFRDQAIDHWAGWWMQDDEVTYWPVQPVDESDDLLESVANSFPLPDLIGKIAVVGLGSIGSAAAESLASYGARNLVLIDPDRLLSHNFARHRSNPDQLGRLKVNAVADQIRHRDGLARIDTHPLNVVFDADLIRPILQDVEVMLVATDGVDSRRAANHLARRAGVPAVFACVLADGAFGEVVRTRPPRDGCLACLRRQMTESGRLDPEPSLDRGYGDSSPHLPMTAVGGDLGLMGALSAKAAVATLLEAAGWQDQRLPGGHAILGLRPRPSIAFPFDDLAAGEVRWAALPPSYEDCVTCSAP